MLIRNLLLLFIITLSSSVIANTQSCQDLSIPIKFSPQGLPIIELSINNANHNALLDLGSSDGIHLPIKEIKNIPTLKYTGTSVKSTNIKGEAFDSKEFVISSLKVNCATFSDIQGVELSPWAASIGEGDVDDGVDQIVVGLGFFNGKKITINYAEKLLIIKNSLNKPASSHDDLIPYKLSKEGISIAMDSGNKNYQMILDTGASNSIFVADKVNPKERLKTCNYDLGPDVKCRIYNSILNVAGHDFQSNILLFPIDKRFEMDGILGSDFFNRFIVDIDFLNKIIALTPIKNQ